MYLKMLFHALSKKLLIATLAIFSTTITYSETESPTQPFVDPAKNCFTSEDINNLNAYFESLNTDPTEDFQQYGINFEGDEIAGLRDHFQSEGFDSFVINHEETDCNQDLGLKLFFRSKVIEGDDVFYSESMWMYLLYKRDGAIAIEFYAVAG